MFAGREDAARKLCIKLKPLSKRKKIIVLALTRGGVVLGKIISSYFKAPLEVLVVKKISAPGDRELAVGAVAPGNIVYWNKDLCRQLSLSKEEKSNLKNEKEKERKEQEKLFKGEHIDIRGKSVILVDDGVATGATAIAASKYLKRIGAKEIILTVPVVSEDTLFYIKRYFDTIYSLKIVNNFYAVGQFFRNFPQVENEQVLKILGKI